MIDALDKEFNILVNKLLVSCSLRGVIMAPYEKLRSPQTQAIYWKQGREDDEILAAINYLKNEKAFFLSSCLVEAEHKSGNILTNALPGFSWHQWGEAIDCCWQIHGKNQWDLGFLNEKGVNGYQVYAEEAIKLGLNSGYYWANIQDAVHVQLQSHSSPIEIFTLEYINKMMQNLFE